MLTDITSVQKSKVNCAITISGNPDLIFLDEPTDNTNAQSRKELWQIISNLKNQGKTIIVTSHYLEELENIATRILILQDGVIAYDGTLQELRLLRGEGTISFTTHLKENHFENITDVVSINHQSDLYYWFTCIILTILNNLIQ